MYVTSGGAGGLRTAIEWVSYKYNQSKEANVVIIPMSDLSLTYSWED